MSFTHRLTQALILLLIGISSSSVAIAQPLPGAFVWGLNVVSSWLAGKGLDKLFFNQGPEVLESLKQRQQELVLALDDQTASNARQEEELQIVRRQIERLEVLLESRPSNDVLRRMEQQMLADRAAAIALLEDHEQRLKRLEHSEAAQRAQLLAVQEELEALRAIQYEPHFEDLRLGWFVALGLGGGALGNSLSGEGGSTSSIDPRPVLLVRSGVRWARHWAVGLEGTYSYWPRREFPVAADSTARVSGTIGEHEGTFAFVFYVNGGRALPVVLYAGPLFDIVVADFSRADTLGASGTVAQHRSALGFTIGLGAEFQRSRFSGTSFFLRYHRTFNNDYLYDRVTGSAEVTSRWMLLGGVAYTFGLE